MARRLTITDIFGVPCRQGEALMAAVIYHPYDKGYEASHVTVRTPFFKVTTDEYSHIIFKDTDAKRKGILRSLLLDAPQILEDDEDVWDMLAGKGRSAGVFLENKAFDSSLAYQAYHAGLTGKLPKMPEEPKGEVLEDTGEAEMKFIKACPAFERAEIRRINPFLYHVSKVVNTGGLLDEATETKRLEIKTYLGEYFEVVTVCGGYYQVAFIITAKTAPQGPPRVSRGREIPQVTYMSHARFDLGQQERQAEREAREARGYKTTLIVVRETTYRDVIALIPEDNIGEAWWHDPWPQAFETIEKGVKNYLKELQKRSDEIDKIEDPVKRSKALDKLESWESMQRSEGEGCTPSVASEGLLNSMERVYTSSLHLAVSTLQTCASLVGAGVPRKQVVKMYLDGFRFLLAMTNNGVVLQDARCLLNGGDFTEDMATVIHANAGRSANYGRKPWGT